MPRDSKEQPRCIIARLQMELPLAKRGTASVSPARRHQAPRLGKLSVHRDIRAKKLMCRWILKLNVTVFTVAVRNFRKMYPMENSSMADWQAYSMALQSHAQAQAHMYAAAMAAAGTAAGIFTI